MDAKALGLLNYQDHLRRCRNPVEYYHRMGLQKRPNLVQMRPVNYLGRDTYFAKQFRFLIDPIFSALGDRHFCDDQNAQYHEICGWSALTFGIERGMRVSVFVIHRRQQGSAAASDEGSQLATSCETENSRCRFFHAEYPNGFDQLSGGERQRLNENVCNTNKCAHGALETHAFTNPSTVRWKIFELSVGRHQRPKIYARYSFGVTVHFGRDF
ncbi:hypothetical protein [Phyllobacterium bourgognense]|uniref:hypothetical protein n=1 Tax=Phyllobacterium bourgognense TaxID=314236 RepID=UPI0015F056E8|nr:hypothetical protein [Phyllobacterium bourgognense]